MHIVIKSLKVSRGVDTPCSSQALVDMQHISKNRCLEPVTYLMKEKRKPKNVKEPIN